MEYLAAKQSFEPRRFILVKERPCLSENVSQETGYLKVDKPVSIVKLIGWSLGCREIQKCHFHKKNFLLRVNLKNVVKQKKVHKGHISGRKKIFQPEKIKIEGVTFISKI